MFFTRPWSEWWSRNFRERPGQTAESNQIFFCLQPETMVCGKRPVLVYVSPLAVAIFLLALVLAVHFSCMAYKLDALHQFLALPEPYRCPTCPYCNGSRSPAPRFVKPDPWTFWNSIGQPKFVVAPMVDQSELPFRALCKKYGATLAYSPMFHSKNFSESPEYRRWQFSTDPTVDRPLFVQFCGHDGDTVLAAARHVEDQCDAVDLNLGCPQGIARRGQYGSFLMERWDVIHTILHTLSVELKIPVTAKMRVFEDEGLTLRYARMLRDAGAHVIAVHGRTREMKGAETGLADLNMIRKVKQHITSVPVIANGNILQFADAVSNLAATGCDAVMSAEALLWDARLFSNPPHPVLTGRNFQCDKITRLAGVSTAIEYMDVFVRRFRVDLGFCKAHIFKLVHHSLEVFPEMRLRLGDYDCHATSLDEFVTFLRDLHALEVTHGPDGPYTKRPKGPKAAVSTDGSSFEAGDGDAAACDAKQCATPPAADDDGEFFGFELLGV